MKNSMVCGKCQFFQRRGVAKNWGFCSAKSIMTLAGNGCKAWERGKDGK